jgi:hypothetical protein
MYREAGMTAKVVCPQCRSNRVTDGSSRFIAAIGVIVIAIGLFALFGLCCEHQIDDWATYNSLADHDGRALPVIALGIILLVGGSRHPSTLYCEACGYKWERTNPPTIRLRPNGHHRP